MANTRCIISVVNGFNGSLKEIILWLMFGDLNYSLIENMEIKEKRLHIFQRQKKEVAFALQTIKPKAMKGRGIVLSKQHQLIAVLHISMDRYVKSTFTVDPIAAHELCLQVNKKTHHTTCSE